MTDTAIAYGQALYGLAAEENLTGEILLQLQTLDGIFAQEPDFERLLSTTSIPKKERYEVLDRCLEDRVHPYVLNFLKILTEKGYVRYFSSCCQVYRWQHDRDAGILPVVAYTALPLSEALREKLKNKLASVTGKIIDLECRVDPACMGGVRLEFDGKQIDGTIRHELDKIRTLLGNTVL